ncbi:DUF2500 domain-containing protein [Kineosporia sp. J2-2]|uniref:DUF2500 domain-containing protein n=1 Tax=Kineosporia corallincola TaxID=2835133 RepID=A0ABS5TI55_9ACTN|nr:DUF2500 domain-containing protein [Kineosporia corallincola]MBT0769269.1 DUF2500 domain-containing protein [Kineosporia corallincola]
MGDSTFLDDFGIFGVVVVGGMALILLLVVLGFATAVVKGLGQWTRNNNSPVEVVDAVLLTRRTEHRHSQDSSSTAYYVTFEHSAHRRTEFLVSGHQWGTLVEGDRGRLTFQGTRFQGFDRVPQDR